MATNAQEALRQLCSDYFHGLVPKEAYRKKRAALLDEAILGVATPEKTDPDRTQPRPVIPASSPQAAPAQATVAPAPVGRRPMALYAGIAGALLLVAATLAWMLTSRQQADAPPPVAGAAVSVPLQEALKPVEPDAFVSRFRDANVWTQETLGNFLFEWDQLTGPQQDAVRASDSFQALTGDLKTRILESRALADPADKRTVDEFKLMVTFARNLDIDPGVSDIEAPPVEIPKVAAAAPAQPTSAVPPAPVPDNTPAAPAGAEAGGKTTAVAPPTAKAATPPPAAVAAAAVAAGTAPIAGQQPAAPRGASNRPCRRELAGADANRRSCFDLLGEGVKGPLMMVLPAGAFTMGSNEDKTSSPAHPVTIAAPLAVGVNEVSVGEYRMFCSETKRSCAMLPAGQDDYPMVGVTWQDAVDYTAWLSSKTGSRYRLPSEAEWEYAARGGTQTRYPFGEDVNQGQAAFGIAGPMARAQKVVPNGFGLRHTVGNVREWTADGWSPGHSGAPADGKPRAANGNQRVARGGAFSDGKKDVTSASRSGADGAVGHANTGFRLVREL